MRVGAGAKGWCARARCRATHAVRSGAAARVLCLPCRHAVEDVPAECLDDLGKYLAEGFALACPEGAEGGVLPRQVQELTEEQRRKRMADYQKAARSLELGLVGDVSDSFVRHGKGMGLYMPDRRWGRPQYPRGA